MDLLKIRAPAEHSLEISLYQRMLLKLRGKLLEWAGVLTGSERLLAIGERDQAVSRIDVSRICRQLWLRMRSTSK
jgi:hypothetical protein